MTGKVRLGVECLYVHKRRGYMYGKFLEETETHVTVEITRRVPCAIYSHGEPGEKFTYPKKSIERIVNYLEDEIDTNMEKR